MGFQMAAAYTGSTLVPPMLGLLAANINLGIFPIFIVIFAIAMLLCTEQLNRFVARIRTAN